LNRLTNGNAKPTQPTSIDHHDQTSSRIKYQLQSLSNLHTTTYDLFNGAEPNHVLQELMQGRSIMIENGEESCMPWFALQGAAWRMYGYPELANISNSRGGKGFEVGSIENLCQLAWGVKQRHFF